MKNYLVFLLLLFVTPGCPLSGQPTLISDNYKFRRISPEGGLGNNGLRDALQDQWGFVWTITVNDLFRFDGYTFKRYTNKLPKSDNQSNWTLFQLAADSAGIIYVGSNSGLLKYNPLADNFDRIYDEMALLIREDAKGRIWLSSKTIGIYDGVKNTFTPVKCSNNTIQAVTAICDDQAGLFIGTEKGELYRLNESLMEFECILANVGRNIIDINRLDSALYVLTEHEGLFVVDLNNKQIMKRHTFFYPEGDTRVIVRDLFIDKLGLVWISTQQGIFILDPGTDKHAHFHYNKDNSYGLPSSSIWKIIEGNQDNLLIGSYSGGLTFFSYNDKNIFKSFNAKTDGLSFPVVSSFAEDDHYLWIGTEGGGLNRYNKQNGEFTHYMHHKSGNSLSFGNINAMSMIGDQLWIALPRGGVDCMDTKTGQFTHYVSTKSENSLANNHVAKLVADGDAGIWIVYIDGAINLSHFSFAGKQFRHFQIYDKPNYLNSSITDICPGNEDTLWVASTQLYVMNARSEAITPCPAIGPEQAQWNSINIQTIRHHKPTGDVWIGSNGQGLIKYSVSKRQYTLEADLSKYEVHSINAIEFDDNDNVWLGTDNGLFRFKPDDGQLLQFNKADGTQGKMYYKNAAYKSKSGKLYFGGNEGFTIVDPTLVSRNEYEPEVIISELFINN